PCALHNLTELVVTSGLKPKMAILGNFLTINLSLSSFQRTNTFLSRKRQKVLMDGYFAFAKNLIKPSKPNKTSTCQTF
ncbi:hypothetical protein ACQCWA_24040, partial [Rossellomorea aquimaris]|uniref:hypothetical protein n=1 Tax=Rossellomorea aquimaris TaxID=189382 RepID=UPI003CEC012F